MKRPQMPISDMSKVEITSKVSQPGWISEGEARVDIVHKPLHSLEKVILK